MDFFTAVLTHNTCVCADSQGVKISKVKTSGNQEIILSFHEWFEISLVMPEINKKVKLITDQIFNCITAGPSGDKLSFENYERIISDKVAISVSVFKPKDRHQSRRVQDCGIRNLKQERWKQQILLEVEVLQSRKRQMEATKKFQFLRVLSNMDCSLRKASPSESCILAFSKKSNQLAFHS